MGWVILRDLPKHRVRLDVVEYPVEGGFRGFQNVPEGYHVVRVFAPDGQSALVELTLPRPASAVVFRWEDGTLAHDTSEEAQSMARSAPSMRSALIDPMATHAAAFLGWQAATAGLNGSVFDAPPDKLAELQSAFVRTVLGESAEPLIAQLQAHYNAGERRVAAEPDYYAKAARAIAGMFKAAPSLATPGGAARERCEWLIEDLEDVGQGDAAHELRGVL